MPNTQAVPSSAAAPAIRRLLRFLRAALSHASGSLVAIAALLGSARAMSVFLGSWARGHVALLQTLYRLVPSELTAGCMLVAVLLAQQCVRNGAQRLTAYVPIVIAAAIVSGLIATPLILLMYDHGIAIDRPYRQVGALGTALFYSADALARGGLMAFIFANRESLLTSIRQLRAAELGRAQAERDLANSHLVAIESMVQPETLIASLKSVSTLYEKNRSEGDNRLAALIEELRSIALAIRP